jgi:hypothetical protein
VTRDERTAIRFAINTAKRAWLEAEGGYRNVEYDARCMDKRIAGRGRGTHDPTRLERAKAMRAEGMSYVAIGAELGFHHSTVWGWLHPDRQTKLLEQQAKRRFAISRSQSTSDVG